MSAIHEVLLPKWGTTMQEADIVEILVAVGDTVSEGQPLVSIETDKVETEVESPYAGVVRAIRAAEGQSIAVGEVLLTVEAP